MQMPTVPNSECTHHLAWRGRGHQRIVQDDQAGEQHFYMGLAGERPVLKGGWQENGSLYRGGGCLENNRGVERPMLQTCTEDAFAIPFICNSVVFNCRCELCK